MKTLGRESCARVRARALTVGFTDIRTWGKGAVAMNKEAGRDGEGYKVECTWCGVIIRRSNVKDSHGMCLKCYARMLGEHGHAHEQGNVPRWASDR
jgi:hypothetical protein